MHYTTKELVELTGLTRSMINWFIKEGRLKPKKIAGALFYDKNDRFVKQLIEEKKRRDKMVRLSDVAEAAGIEREILRSMCRKGTIKGERFGRHWYIAKEDAERIMAVGR